MTTSVRITVPENVDYKVAVSSYYKSDPAGRPLMQEFLPGDDVVLHIWDDKAIFICEVPKDLDIVNVTVDTNHNTQ
jgi:hypothetical protein